VIAVSTPTASATVLTGPGREFTRIRTLAQRSLLASETESFEHLRLSPGATHERHGRSGTESVWFVLRGLLVAEQLPGGSHHLADEGDLLLVPGGGGLRLKAGPLGAELLGLTLHTPAPRRGRSRRTTRP
jgi:hypothetical protein